MAATKVGPSWQEVCKARRAEILARAKEGKGVSNEDVVALTAITLALNVDYISDSLHRVGEGA